MNQRMKDGLNDGCIPFIIMLLSTAAALVLCTFVTKSNKKEFQVVMNVGGEETNPSYGRLIYCLSSFFISMLLIILSEKIYTISKNKDNKIRLLIAWFLSVMSGTMLWQSIGETSWHFGFWIESEDDNNKETFTNFPRIESIQGIPFFIILIILFFYLLDKIGFGVMGSIATFIVNWYGHLCLIGTYPIVKCLGSSLDENTWYKISGTVNGIIFLIIGSILIFSDKISKESKCLSSLCWYVGFGVIIFGFRGE